MGAFDQQRCLVADAELVAGHFFAVGPNGDTNPGAVLDEVVITNPGEVDLRVGHSLTGILAGRYTTLLAGAARPIAGACDNLIVYNPEASDPGAWDLDGVVVGRNSGGVYEAAKLGAGVAHRGPTDLPLTTTRYRVVRLTGTAGEIVELDAYFSQQVDVVGVKLYGVTIGSGANIRFDALKSTDSILLAFFDLETLVTKTLTAMTLTATTARLTLPVGTPLTLRYSSSSGGDSLGDLLVEIAYR